MAQYDVDIQLAIRNKNALQGLQKELNAISDAVDAINDKSIDVTGKRRENAIKDFYKNVENASLKVLEKVDKATTTAHKNQQKVQLKLENDLFQDKLDKINKLTDAEIAASKEANEAALKDFDKRLENRVARRKGSLFGTATARERAGAAVSAGAFPLLFGGGPGMALGGAIGGAVTGKTFGPAAIALQVLGGFFDELAAKAATLGQALNLATADIDAVVESLGLVGSPTQDAIKSLEELAGEQLALEEATRQLSLVVGDKGVEALKEFGDASTRLGNALTQITTQLLAAIAQFSGPVVTQALRALEFQADLSAARQSSDPRQQLLQGQLQNINLAEDVVFGQQRADIEAEMVKLQRQIKKEAEAALQAKVEAARVGSAEHVIAKNNLAIAQLDGDLTDERIFRLEKANIFQEARKKLLEDGADVKLIEIEREERLLALTNKRNDLIKAANERAQRLSDREQRAIDRKAREVEREMARANKAFSKQMMQQDELYHLLLQQNDIFAQIGQTIEDGLVRGLTNAITGAKSLGEALSGVFKSVGGMFLKQGIGSIVGNVFGSFGGGSVDLASGINSKSLFDNATGLPAFADIPVDFKYASGGFVDQPTRAVIGEGGESEYVIPSSKMNEAMGRYARGARGGAVIPDGPGGDASGGMTGGGGSIDVSYSVERINNVNYVTAAEFERGMAQAAKRGAELGRRNVYSDLVNKRSVRSRVGV